MRNRGDAYGTQGWILGYFVILPIHLTLCV